jgi:hypothetical protein
VSLSPTLQPRSAASTPMGPDEAIRVAKELPANIEAYENV